jgi:hypothetical protein
MHGQAQALLLAQLDQRRGAAAEAVPDRQAGVGLGDHLLVADALGASAVAAPLGPEDAHRDAALVAPGFGHGVDAARIAGEDLGDGESGTDDRRFEGLG